jgi:23S rRNA pseudouridine2605 synthase
MLIRLNKLIADSGLCSRRAADALIASQRVRVDGLTVLEAGCKIDPALHAVMVDGQPLPKPQALVSLILHKPVGYVTSRRAQSFRQKTIYELLPQAYQAVDPAGRLDEDSSGLLILSTDGQFVHRLMHPKFHWPKIYEFGTNQPLDETALAKLREGVWFEPEERLARMDIEPIAKMSSPLPLGVSIAGAYRATLITGYKRQIRRSVEAVGCRVRSLQRTAFGDVLLGDLDPGTYRLLSETEYKMLQQDISLDSSLGESKLI